MRRSLATKLVLAISVFGIVLPILGALYVAHQQSIKDESRTASVMAAEVLRRVDEAGVQAITAYRRLLEPAVADAPCADSRLLQMREIDLASSYLQLVGYVENQRLLCSSMGRHGDGIELGQPDYTSAVGAQVRLNVLLGGDQGTHLLVMQKGSYAAAMRPEMLVDVFVERPDTALGVYGRTGRQRIAGRGDFDLRWLDRLGEARDTVFFDGKYLVAMRRSASFDTVAYAAVPAVHLTARLSDLALVLVPVGLLFGAALSLGMYLLARQQSSLPAELRAALKRREFKLHYQPIVTLDSRRTVGFEALLRWTRADGTRVRPDLFIPAAEDCGLISQFTAYVLHRVRADLPRLLAHYPDCYISVNLGAADLQSEAIIDLLRAVIDQPGVNGRNLIVEATEHSFLDMQIGRNTVEKIRALGIQVAIDDFGTGYSGLSHLANLGADYLKIDKVFVDTVGTDSATGQVALHIIRIAESLSLKIIGEGVESEAQAAFLREHGVEFAQGWLFDKALPLDTILDSMAVTRT